MNRDHIISESVRELHWKLQGIPKSQWPCIIARLSDEDKKNLLNYLKTKSLDVGENYVEKTMVLRTDKLISPSSNDSSVLSNPHDCDEQRESIVATYPISKSLPKAQSLGGLSPNQSGTEFNKPHKCNIPKFQNKSFFFKEVSQSLPSEFDTSFIDTENVCLLSEKPLLEVLRKLVYIAGDGQSPLKECVELIHTYLDVWFAIMWSALNRKAFLIHLEKKKIVSTMLTFIQEQFPLEYDRFNVITRYRKKFEKQKNPMIYVEPTELESGISNNNSAEFREFQNESTCLAKPSSHIDGDKCKSINIDDRDELIKDLLSSERFDYRLAYADSRTAKMTTDEYSRYSKTRIKALKYDRSLICNWLNKSAINSSRQYLANFFSANTNSIHNHEISQHSNLDGSKNELHDGSLKKNDVKFNIIPNSLLEFWIFLLLDRVSTIVETAERVRRSTLPYPTVDRIRSKQQCLVPFRQILKIQLDRINDSAENSNTTLFAMEQPLSSIHYKIAIELFLNIVDASMFNVVGPLSIDHFSKIQKCMMADKSCNKNDNEYNTNSSSKSISIYDHDDSFTAFECVNDIYHILKLDSSPKLIEDLGINGIWSRIIDLAENSGYSVPIIPHINVFSMYLSIRLKDEIWSNRHRLQIDKLLLQILSDWIKINTEPNQIFDDSALNLSVAHMQQLQKYLKVAKKLSCVMDFFLQKYVNVFSSAFTSFGDISKTIFSENLIKSVEKYSCSSPAVPNLKAERTNFQIPLLKLDDSPQSIACFVKREKSEIHQKDMSQNMPLVHYSSLNTNSETISNSGNSFSCERSSLRGKTSIDRTSNCAKKFRKT